MKPHQQNGGRVTSSAPPVKAGFRAGGGNKAPTHPLMAAVLARSRQKELPDDVPAVVVSRAEDPSPVDDADNNGMGTSSAMDGGASVTMHDQQLLCVVSADNVSCWTSPATSNSVTSSSSTANSTTTPMSAIPATVMSAAGGANNTKLSSTTGAAKRLLPFPPRKTGVSEMNLLRPVAPSSGNTLGALI
ncbi:unnamed protein product [Notodromas monacha]|uniref:Uncharacterized protein n=1 Tax=Notodromas monacha TaxID=399045 RepID=A0A7R9BD25_9CRUS|nr:unnamed protein product [Notodromas monacha]CAG0912428.1 unnamed protein product [Notodromas monacha]